MRRAANWRAVPGEQSRGSTVSVRPAGACVPSGKPRPEATPEATLFEKTGVA